MTDKFYKVPVEEGTKIIISRKPNSGSMMFYIRNGSGMGSRI